MSKWLCRDVACRCAGIHHGDVIRHGRLGHVAMLWEGHRLGWSDHVFLHAACADLKEYPLNAGVAAKAPGPPTCLACVARPREGSP